MSLQVCPGLPDCIGGSCIEHSVPKVFSLSTIDNSPLFQTKYYRSPSCQILIPLMLVNCAGCVKALAKENLSLEINRDNQFSPAKPKESLTSPGRIKLTLQHYRLENKQLKHELEEIQ